MWSAYDACKDIVRQEWATYQDWNSQNSALNFHKTTKNSLAALKIWSKKKFGGRQKEIEKFMKQLKEIKQNYKHYEGGEDLRRTEQKINNHLIDEEMYWKQRSRADWIREGDKNTKYFHSRATSRKRKNKIWGIENNQGKWIKEKNEVDKEFCEYFQDLFSSLNHTKAQMDAALEGMKLKVTEEMNDRLAEPFTAEDISEALAQMCPTKAPGLNGLPTVFYHKHSQFVKEWVLSTCLHILNDQGIIAPLHHTYIALIPKIAKPRKVTDYRPISLCNVIYRIVTKAIANRLKPMLDQIIAPT
ncbi:hypothetical protein AB3S75_024574 [Citrus x aurantiifolia]